MDMERKVNMNRLTKYSNDIIRNKAINIIRKLSERNGLKGDELAVISAFCLIERIENKVLKEYEDLEEQKKLLKLPCAVGDTVYRINKGAEEPIIPMTVLKIGTLTTKTGDLVIQIKCRDNADKGETYYFNSDFEKNVFFSKEAAAALREL